MKNAMNFSIVQSKKHFVDFFYVEIFVLNFIFIFCFKLTILSLHTMTSSNFYPSTPHVVLNKASCTPILQKYTWLLNLFKIGCCHYYDPGMNNVMKFSTIQSKKTFGRLFPMLKFLYSIFFNFKLTIISLCIMASLNFYPWTPHVVLNKASCTSILQKYIWFLILFQIGYCRYWNIDMKNAMNFSTIQSKKHFVDVFL